MAGPIGRAIRVDRRQRGCGGAEDDSLGTRLDLPAKIQS